MLYLRASWKIDVVKLVLSLNKVFYYYHNYYYYYLHWCCQWFLDVELGRQFFVSGKMERVWRKRDVNDINNRQASAAVFPVKPRQLPWNRGIMLK